jgi:hypothetical protein
VPNANWLGRLLRYPLSQVCGVPLQVQVLHWGHGFDTNAFYAACGLQPTLQDWARIHYAETLPPQAAALIEHTFRDSIVIAYEMPPCVAAVLTRLGIPLIDTISHPVRFLDDMLFAWRSNVAAVNERIGAFEFDLEHSNVQAGLISAKMAWTPPLALPPGTGLLIGQVHSDKAMIHKREGRLLGFGDFVEQLFEIAAAHETVLYKPHPYECADPLVHQVVGRFKSFRRTDRNFYQLLSQPELSAVYAVSSGTCVEAPYFGKSATWFYEYLYDLDRTSPDAFGLPRPVPVEQVWLWPTFWRSVLEPLIPVREGQWPELPFRPNRIRRSMNADWGFGAVDAVVSALS